VTPSNFDLIIISVLPCFSIDLPAEPIVDRNRHGFRVVVASIGHRGGWLNRDFPDIAPNQPKR
jgi:hypothetical protein